MLWFVKSKRAQSKDDDESWKRGGVTPTLNAFDMGDTRATVVICYPINTMTLGGRPDPMNDARMTLGVGDEGDPQFTISSSHPHAVAIYPTVIIFYGNRVDDIRMQGDVINTLQARMGTGGGNMPLMNEGAVVRRLTPTECERLQGFPDGWTEGQADSHRYKQMGNAVAVPVVEWIMERLVACDKKNQSNIV